MSQRSYHFPLAAAERALLGQTGDPAITEGESSVTAAGFRA